MAQHYKSKAILFLALTAFTSNTISTNESISAVRIVNTTKSDLKYSHTLPGDSVTHIYSLSLEFPKAMINYWYPIKRLVSGNNKYFRELDERKPVGTYLRIGFSKEVTQSFVEDFFETLKSTHDLFCNIHPNRHARLRDVFSIKIGPHYSQDEIGTFIEKVNIAMYKKWVKTMAASIREYA